MAKFSVHVEDSVDYVIEADCEADAKEIAWDWFSERKPNFKIVEEGPEYGTMTWRDVAEMLQEDIEIDWENKSFICPFCQEPILQDDWYYIPCEIDEGTHPFCPICGFFFED